MMAEKLEVLNSMINSRIGNKKTWLLYLMKVLKSFFDDNLSQTSFWEK